MIGDLARHGSRASNHDAALANMGDKSELPGSLSMMSILGLSLVITAVPFAQQWQSSGWPSAWAWFVGLLQAAYTLTGYGMVAAMCEEVQMPEREVPGAMVLLAAAAGITGIIYLIPILFVLPDVSLLLSVANGQPIGLVFKITTGSPGSDFELLFLLLGIPFFVGVGALTAASRCTYAFASDGAIPGSRLWARVDKKLDIPLWGLIFYCILRCIYFGSTSALNAFTGVATICLSVSYGIPIFVSLIRGWRAVRHSTFSLGRFGFIINLATVVWIMLAIVLFCIPTAIPVTPTSMNYASVAFMGFALISVGWYVVRVRKEFTGPPVPADVEPEHDGEVVGGLGKTLTNGNTGLNSNPGVRRKD